MTNIGYYRDLQITVLYNCVYFLQTVSLAMHHPYFPPTDALIAMSFPHFLLPIHTHDNEKRFYTIPMPMRRHIAFCTARYQRLRRISYHYF